MAVRRRSLSVSAIGAYLRLLSPWEGSVMNNVAEAVDVGEPAELSFGEKKGQASPIATDMIPFSRLSAALIYAVETMHDSHRPRCLITTRSGSIYRWSQITTLYEHAKTAM
jgi:hypothetical protein